MRLTEASQQVRLVSGVAVRPPVLTPNGDGINDEVQIGYDLVRIAVPAPVRVTLYDLSGKEVHVLFDAEALAGAHSHRWDGRDGSGRLVTPGLYVAWIEVLAAHETVVRQILVAVAY